MTKRIFPAVLSLMALFIFSACDTVPSEPAQIQTQSPQTQQTPTEMPAQQAEIPASEADIAAYSGAMQLMDETYCDKIADTAYKATCKTELADTKNLNEALTSIDAALCDKLSTEDKKEACKISVQVQLDEQKQQEERLEKDAEQQILSQSIVDSKDHTRCNELEDGNQREACEMNIILNRAFAENDIAICDLMSTEEGKSSCIANFKEANE